MGAEGVRIKTTARLHLGFLDLAGDLGREFGSMGLAIDGFDTEIGMRRAPKFSASGREAPRVERLVRRFAEALGRPPAVAVEVSGAIPAHAGLGSGTQLALAIGLAFRTLYGLAADTAADAAILDRGGRSGVGVGLFGSGGFMLDVGRGAKTTLPPIVTRLRFPEAWRIVLILDRDLAGAHGEAERAAFAALPAFSRQAAAEICRRALMQVLPGVAEADFDAFGAGVSSIQRLLGDHFAPAQGGGLFTSRRVGRVAAKLDSAGALGVGQSSWGPTGFVFARDSDEALRLASLARTEARGEVDIQIHAARARGPDIIL